MLLSYRLSPIASLYLYESCDWLTFSTCSPRPSGTLSLLLGGSGSTEVLLTGGYTEADRLTLDVGALLLIKGATADEVWFAPSCC